MEGEEEDAVHVDILDDGVLVLQLGQGQLLHHTVELAMVGLLVDALLIDVDLNQPLPALLDGGDSPLGGLPRLIGARALLVERGQHLLLEEHEVLACRLEPAQHVHELLLQHLGAQLHRPALFAAAVVVTVAPAVAARPRGGQWCAARAAAHEAPEGEVGMVLLPRQLAGAPPAAAQRLLGAQERLCRHDRLEGGLGIDSPLGVDDTAAVERIPYQVMPGLGADLVAADGPQAALGHLPPKLLLADVARGELLERPADQRRPLRVGLEDAAAALEISERRGGAFSAEVRLFLGMGFLGSMTTFSTFGYETVELLRRAELGLALAYGLGSLLLGALGVVGGALFVRWFGG